MRPSRTVILRAGGRLSGTVARRHHSKGVVRLGILDHLPDPLGGRRHLDVGHAIIRQRVDDGVHHRGERAGATRLAAAFDAERIGAGGHRMAFESDFRNVSGKVPEYNETFVDEGDIDMGEIVAILDEAGYEGVLIPDHTPDLHCAASWHAGMGFALGYMRALIQERERGRGRMQTPAALKRSA